MLRGIALNFRDFKFKIKGFVFYQIPIALSNFNILRKLKNRVLERYFIVLDFIL